LDEVFGPEGMIARHFSGYEERPSQVKVARAIHEAVVHKRHALVEGPTGTGKAAAQLAVALYQAVEHGKRVLICTATIALQEQLVDELNRLVEILPWRVEVAVLKGLGNYACHEQVQLSSRRGELNSFYTDELQQQADDVLTWFGKTSTGDVAELPFVPDPLVWSRVSTSSDECKGEDCPHHGACFAEKAKRDARAARIVVTNTSMLCAYLSVVSETGNHDVLPPFDLLMIDEAHELADTARGFFGFTLSEPQLRRLTAGAKELELEEHADKLRIEGGAFFEQLRRHRAVGEPGGVLRGPLSLSADAFVAALNALYVAAEGLDPDVDLADCNRADARLLARRAQKFAARLREAVTIADKKKVYFVELDDRGRARLCAKLVDVADLLRRELFGRVDSVILVSATLATGGNFEFVRRELGVPVDALQLAVDSPFDFERQALLVIPEDLPLPNDPSFADEVGTTLARVVEHCRGRTLGLFTSHKVLAGARSHVAGGEYRVLCQGEHTPKELRRLFKEDVSSVLLGTGTFWTGIDVPGEALTAVVIDRLPFPHPEDPVIQALCADDPQGFNRVMVPRAIIKLRQGVGRLIRTKSDVGVVVLLDRRIAEHAYGTRILDSLPAMRTTRKLENINRFLDEAA